MISWHDNFMFHYVPIGQHHFTGIYREDFFDKCGVGQMMPHLVSGDNFGELR